MIMTGRTSGRWHGTAERRPLIVTPRMVAALLLVGLAVRTGRADELIGTNGERFVGRVVTRSDTAVVFESELGGRVTVPRDRIRELRETSAASPDPAHPPAAASASNPSPAPPPLPPGAEGDGFDWIQLKSGEWLKGRLKAMQNEQLEFDSEKLKLQKFDWKDVDQVRSTQNTRLMIEAGKVRTTAAGPVRVTRDSVMVGEPGATTTYPRMQVVAITPGGERELDKWSGKVVAGVTLRAGNTEQVDASAQISLQRRTPETRLGLEYLGNFSRLDSEENANNHRVTTEFDYWLSHRFFIRVPYLEYFRDPFQNIDDRLTAGAGIGYDIIDRPRAEWNVTIGPAYQHNWYTSVEPGQPTDAAAAALFFGSRLDWELSSKIDLILEYRGQFTRREIGDTTHHGTATLEVELTKRLDLDVSLIWDRISNPAPAANGTEPKPDDFRLILGLGVDF